MQTTSYRDGIGRLREKRRDDGVEKKSNDDREGYGRRTGVGTGVGFGKEGNRKNSMEKHKETREGFGTGAGIFVMVCIGILVKV